MPAYPLPKHIAYSQSLARYVKDNLSDSTAQALTFAELCQLAADDFSAENIGATRLSYSPIQGDEKLREEIVKFHQNFNDHSQILAADNAVTFSGAQEALSAIYQTLLRAGDEIVVLTPSYPSLVTMAKSMGVMVREISLCADNDWQVNIADFKRVVNDKTRLIVLNSPHNPTGSIIESTLAAQILKLAEHFQCYLLSDDVSQASNYHGLALAHSYLDYRKSIVVGVMSKSLGLAGLRIGWVVTQNEDLIVSLLAIKAVGSICCSKMDEQLAYLALKNSTEILITNNNIILNNIALFSAFVARHPESFSWQPPKAGILALVGVKNIVSITSWSQTLAKQSGILALPSKLFGLHGNYFRLGLGQRSFAETLDKLEQHQLKSSR